MKFLENDNQVMRTDDESHHVKAKSKAANTGLIFALTFSVFAFNGCKSEGQNINRTNANSAKSNQNSVSNSKIKLFNGKGVVTKINFELGSVELDHEEIKGAMPAMIMEFYVKEKSEIEVLKIGDKVEFVLEENFGQEKIISIKKIQ